MYRPIAVTHGNVVSFMMYTTFMNHPALKMSLMSNAVGVTLNYASS